MNVHSEFVLVGQWFGDEIGGFIGGVKRMEGGFMQGGEFSVSTSKRMELIDITSQVSQALLAAGAGDGLCFLYNPHTTAGLTINEGADPAVRDDILAVFKQMIPMDYPYKHLEGNSPAHIMCSLMGSSSTVIVENGMLRLGTWQKIYFCEFDGPRTRNVLWRMG